MEHSDGKERAIPAWVGMVFAMMVPLIASGVGYGEVRARVAALEQRLDRAEVSAREDRDRAAAAMEKLAGKIEELGRTAAAICVRVQCDGGGRR